MVKFALQIIDLQREVEKDASGVVISSLSPRKAMEHHGLFIFKTTGRETKEISQQNISVNNLGLIKLRHKKFQLVVSVRKQFE